MDHLDESTSSEGRKIILSTTLGEERLGWKEPPEVSQCRDCKEVFPPSRIRTPKELRSYLELHSSRQSEESGEALRANAVILDFQSRLSGAEGRLYSGSSPREVFE